jgi:hypothetical protein
MAMTMRARGFYDRLTINYRLASSDFLLMQRCRRSYKMDMVDTSNGFVRDPLAWAADCSTYASSETEPEARDAYAQLAEEFESVSAEIEGLISTFEALTKRKRGR